jgi:uncharacterized membrane protein YhiD involved in acid resistance
LNAIYAGAAIGIAAVFGAIARSWVLFVLIVASLFAVFNQTGQIRSQNDRKRNRRR